MPRLQVRGAYGNDRNESFGNFETPLVFANARLTDTLFVASPSADPYVITADLVIDGVLDVDGSNGRVNALLELAPAGALSVTQTKIYQTNGVVVDDVLTASVGFVGDAELDIESALFFGVPLPEAAPASTTRRGAALDTHGYAEGETCAHLARATG